VAQKKHVSSDEVMFDGQHIMGKTERNVFCFVGCNIAKTPLLIYKPEMGVHRFVKMLSI